MNPKKDWIEAAKRKTALRAIAHVKDGFIVGLGSGSTAAYAIEGLGERIKRDRLCIKGIPTSYQAFLLAVKHGISITTLEEHPNIDITIDGADQIDAKLDLIKGIGGALVREKIIASASERNIIVADESKNVKVLGENNHPVPIEVMPFALSIVKHRLEKMGGKIVMRTGKGKVGPVITDNGNMILDAFFGPINDSAKLEARLKVIPGLIETGLFIEMANIAYIGTPSDVKMVQK